MSIDEQHTGPDAETGPRDSLPAPRVAPLDVAIVGAGPVGVFLAILLAQRGLSVQVLERRREPRRHSRAIGIHPPSLEALNAAGLAVPILNEAVKIRRGELRSGGRTLGGLTFDGVSPEFPFVAALQQHRTESLLAAKLEECAPGALRRGIDVTGVEQDGELVRLRWHDGVAEPDSGAGPGSRAGSGPGAVDARIVVGADGANSFVRSAAGIGTRSRTYPDTYLMGDFTDTTSDDFTAVIWLETGGVVESFPLPGGIRRWVARTKALIEDPTPAQLSALIRERTGVDVPAQSNSMLSAFAVRGQIAESMYAGRTMLVGDAAHEVSPIGGQGMNLGWLDAVAMAPVIAETVAQGGAPSGQAARTARGRMRAAVIAARHAHINMAMGRPVGRWAAGPRDAALRLLLASPARPLLARAYSMRWL